MRIPFCFCNSSWLVSDPSTVDSIVLNMISCPLDSHCSLMALAVNCMMDSVVVKMAIRFQPNQLANLLNIGARESHVPTDLETKYYIIEWVVLNGVYCLLNDDEDNTVYKLIRMYHDCFSALNDKTSVGILFLDLTKAFDRVWHTKPFTRLHQPDFQR